MQISNGKVGNTVRGPYPDTASEDFRKPLKTSAGSYEHGNEPVGSKEA
jgi:hypothetical protein